MMLSFGWLLPLGVLSARYMKHRSNGIWFKLHRALQSTGLFLGLVGFSIAVTNVNVYQDPKSSTSYQHGVLGATVFTIALLQPIMAYFRPAKVVIDGDDGDGETATMTSFTTTRTRWELLHKFVGYLLLLLIFVTIMLGAKMEGTSWIAGYLLDGLGSLGIVWVLMWYDRFFYQPPEGASDGAGAEMA